MLYYFLPGAGIFGGVKVACQFVDLLGSLGIRAAVALPGAQAPQWFASRAAVLDDAEVLRRLDSSDWLMITWPPDYQRLRDTHARLVCHCQGTDDRMDVIFADPAVPILTCWEQAARYARERFGREIIHVGIAISDCFYFDGCRKEDNLVAYMPRRGFPTVRECIRSNPDLDFLPLDGLAEVEVGRRLKRAGVFLATALGEQFGLPAVEAMAAGCVVLSVPVKGGMEYLRDGDNCLVVDPEEMPTRLCWITRSENAILRAQLRARALATAQQYRLGCQRRRLADLLTGELRWLTS